MSKLEIDADLIRRLADLLDETGLSEIEVGAGEMRIRVARDGVAHAPAAQPGPVTQPGPTPAAAPAEQPRLDASHPGAVTSPMVGTLYVAPETDAPPFVNVGDAVTKGQTLFIIEAMKVMNPIRAPRAGTVAKLMVGNGDPVEFGEVLLILE